MSCLARACAIAVMVALSACATSESEDSESVSDLTPLRWQTSGTWRFHVIDNQQRDLGTIVLRLTPEPMEEDSCARTGWRRAIVMEDKLDYDFGADKDPAFAISANWITIDLTASVCSIDHILIGELVDDGAAGFFNYSHPLGGYGVGTFKASPIVD